MNEKYDEISLLIVVVISLAAGFWWGYCKGRKSAQADYKRAIEERVKFLEEAGYDSIPRHFLKQKNDVENEHKAGRPQKLTPPTVNPEDRPNSETQP